MRVLIVGLGVQGRKRLAIAGKEAVGAVDPVQAYAQYRRVEEVPLELYDAAILCVPDKAKFELIEYLARHKKNVMAEKPLVSDSPLEMQRLRQCVEQNGITYYTAYNHRFEPHIVRLKELLDSGVMGRVYQCTFFYGNGTARDVRNSEWRDQDLGVFPDLGSHLLDWTLMLFGKPQVEPELWEARCFENRAYDYFHFGFKGEVAIDYRVTLLSWRNTFRCDVLGENGSAHIDCLCKWGPSAFTYRTRKLPSGRPDEESQVLTMADPTWKAEYEHFKQLCNKPQHNIDHDDWINEVFLKIRGAILEKSA